MKKLVVVDRGEKVMHYIASLDMEIDVVHHDEFDGSDQDADRKAIMFFVDDRHIDRVLQRLAEKNPGLDINVYGLEKVGHCPAGAFQAKAVTKAGVLPA